jgi:hypothetical protein
MPEEEQHTGLARMFLLWWDNTPPLGLLTCSGHGPNNGAQQGGLDAVFGTHTLTTFVSEFSCLRCILSSSGVNFGDDR